MQIAIGADAACVMEDFLQLQAAAKHLGLEMSRDKCEIVGHSDDTRSLFVSHGINLHETSPTEVILLGAPLSAGQHLDAVLESKRQELQLLSRHLELMPSHDCLYLLRNVLTAPPLMYLLRQLPARVALSFQSSMPLSENHCLPC